MWTSLRKAAQGDVLTASFVLATLARDFAKGVLEVREVTSGSDPSKSARISDDVWDALKLASKARDMPASRTRNHEASGPSKFRRDSAGR